MARIAVGGFQHETNTFVPLEAGLAQFIEPDAWPGLVRGLEMLDAIAGINLPAAGFVSEARSLGHRIAPLLWCAAQPAGRVTREAFETISALLLTRLADAGRCDAVYLDLHGAMVAEHLDDADGELLRRVRAAICPGVPLVASLDLHANISPAMVAAAEALPCYRSYPHVDMAETGARAAAIVHRIIDRPVSARAHRALPFLMPLTSQCTLIEPLSSLMPRAAELEKGDILSLCLAPGFPLADVENCGPTVIGYGWNGAALDGAADELYREVLAREAEFALELASIDEAIAAARAMTASTRGPLVLTDTQDNPGAGGNADTTSLLKALVAADLPGTAAGIFCDPASVERAHAAGEGATVELSIGGNSAFPGETPLVAQARVLRLGDGRFTGTGPFYRGGRFELGPMARVAVGAVEVLMSSRKQQAADQAMFRHLGLEPSAARVLLLKSSVHFRADFGPIASRVLVVEAPGPNVADPARLPFTKLPIGRRRRP
ncbi:MAG: M81 family metallopeptidase, partial [Steroidobacteraceae bacterium]